MSGELSLMSDSDDSKLLEGLEKIPVNNPEFSDIENRGEDFEGLSSDEITRAYAIVNYRDRRENAGSSEDQLKIEQIKLGLKKQERKNFEAAFLFWTRLGISGTLLVLCIKWMWFIGALLMDCGRGNLKISDAVLVALITTTTIQVLGIYYSA